MLQANRRVGIWVLRWINDNFKTEGGKVGRWKKFRYGGRFRKGKLDTSAKLLQDTGRLRASFDSKPNKKGVTIGSDLEYSKYHEEGVPKKRLPQRRMLPDGKDREVSNAIIKIYDHAIERALK
jgi:phage gpG-like protein